MHFFDLCEFQFGSTGGEIHGHRSMYEIHGYRGINNTQIFIEQILPRSSKKMKMILILWLTASCNRKFKDPKDTYK